MRDASFAILLLVAPFVVAGVAAAIPWRVRETLWWNFLALVLVGAVIGALYTLLSGSGPLFFPTPHD